MSSKAPRRVREDVAADPWWGEPQQTIVETLAPPPHRVRRRTKRQRTGIGWRLLALVARPLVVLGGRMRRSERVRRATVRVLIALLVFAFLACSVGVILINNVVIGRTAELGKLDDKRRELRRENALLGAKAAQLSAPPVVFRRAEHDLGMLRTTELPQFIYLSPGSHTLTPLQRARVAARVARQRAAAASHDGGAASTTTTTTTPARHSGASASTSTSSASTPSATTPSNATTTGASTSTTTPTSQGAHP